MGERRTLASGPPPDVPVLVEPEEAAYLLGVPPEVLEAWRARFGFPRSMFLDGDQAFYSRRELVALRDALGTQFSIPSAIAHAQDAAGFGPAAS